MYLSLSLKEIAYWVCIQLHYSHSKIPFHLPKLGVLLLLGARGAQGCRDHKGWKTEFGENGLGSWSQHKSPHNVWSPWCVTHRVNRSANLHFCPWKLAFTSDSLFWQGFWLVLVLFCPPWFSNIEYFRGNSACFQHLRSVPPKQQTLLRLFKHYFTASLCLSLLNHGVKTWKRAEKKILDLSTHTELP